MDRVAADSEIQTRLAADDPLVVETIWDLYAADLLGYLVGILRSQPDAEDALQEVFLSIVRKRTTVAKARALKPYLFRMAHNIALSSRIRRTRADRRFQESAWLVTEDPGAAPREHEPRVAEALEALPEEQRSVIVLKHYREKTFREIGICLGISEHTAGSRYRYGMEKLRGLLRERGP